MKLSTRSMLACVALGLSAPALAQDWIPLQDGKSLAGWKAAEKPESWVVEDGVFVSRGDRSHLFYVGKVGKHDFRNFEFSADVMTSPGANSGIYVHTKWQGPGWPVAGYELQVINSNPPAEKMDGYVEHKMTVSIYAVRNTWVEPAKDNEWFKSLQPSLFKIGAVVLEPSTEQGKSSGLTFHYSPYAVGAYAEGAYTAFVPWLILRPYLSPEGLAIFGGTKPKDAKTQ